MRFSRLWNSFTEHLAKLFFWFLALLVVAAIVHVSSLLLVPRFASQDAYHRLIQDNPAVQLRLLSPELQSFVGSDPAVVISACPYRLSEGPLRIRTKPDAQEILSIAFHAPDGTAFFAVTDKAAGKDEINILLVTQDQLRAIESEDDPEEPVPELRLVANATEGFVIIRSLVQRPSERPAAERRVMSLICEIDKSEMPEN